MQVKSDQEIKLMRKSGKILAKIFQQVIPSIKPGTTTLEINEKIEQIVLSSNAKPSFKNYHSYQFASCICLNDQLVHGIPKDRKIKYGDIVSIDVGVEYQGYHTDAARTIIIGKTNLQNIKLIDNTKKALLAAINEVRHGVKLSRIQQVIENHAKKNNLSVVKCLTGHGIGKSLQEPPVIANFFQKGNQTVLRKNMTICIEPMFNLGKEYVETEDDGWTIRTKDGKNCAHFEDTILITESGSEILTK